MAKKKIKLCYDTTLFTLKSYYKEKIYLLTEIPWVDIIIDYVNFSVCCSKNFRFSYLSCIRSQEFL